LTLDQPNQEGYVAVWRNPQGPSFRLKLKFPGYVRLHRLITGCREWDVWDHHFRGESLAPLYTETPPEFQAWLRATEEKYVALRSSLSSQVDREFSRCVTALGDRITETMIAQDRALKKAFAECALTIQDPAIKAAVFARVNQRTDWMKPIWKAIEPSGELQGSREDV
jgi:RNA ligase